MTNETTVDPSPVKLSKPTGRVSSTSQVFIISKGMDKDNSPCTEIPSNITFCTLDHPRTRVPCTYIVSEGTLCEVQQVKRDPSSWIIGSSVQRDGSLNISTPIDPVFVLLPVLEKARNRSGEHAGYFTDVQSIMSNVPALRALNVEAIDLGVVCDVKDEQYYRLNDDRVLAWLSLKADAIADYAKTAPHLNTLTASGQVETFKRSSKHGGGAVPRAKLLDVACGFLCEYLSPSWADKLRARIAKKKAGLATTISKAPTSDIGAKTPMAAGKLGGENGDAANQDFSTPRFGSHTGFRAARVVDEVTRRAETKKEAPRSNANKSLQKVNKRGMSSLTSFFGKPKPKKPKTA